MASSSRTSSASYTHGVFHGKGVGRSQRQAQARGVYQASASRRGMLELPVLAVPARDAAEAAALKEVYNHLYTLEWRLSEEEVSADWVEQKCGMHVRVPQGVAGRPGCEGVARGTHPIIRALYAVPHDSCQVEPGARVLDKRLVLHVEQGARLHPKKRGRAAVAVYYRGSGATVGQLGAGYCYTGLFPSGIVMRMARNLSVMPSRFRVAMYFLRFGKAEVPGFVPEHLASGDMHCRYDGARAASRLEVLRALLHGADSTSRVGATPMEADELRRLKVALAALPPSRVVDVTRPAVRRAPAGTGYGMLAQFDRWEEEASDAKTAYAGSARVQGLKGWFLNHGMDVSGSLLEELALASCSNAGLPAAFVDYKARNAVYAGVGDAVVRVWASLKVLAMRRVKADINSMLQGASNAAMAEALNRCGLRVHCDVTGLRVDGPANADIYEAIVGVLASYDGVVLAYNFIALTMEYPELPVPVSGSSRDSIAASTGQARNVTDSDLDLIARLKAAGVIQ